MSVSVIMNAFRSMLLQVVRWKNTRSGNAAQLILIKCFDVYRYIKVVAVKFLQRTNSPLHSTA